MPGLIGGGGLIAGGAMPVQAPSQGLMIAGGIGAGLSSFADSFLKARAMQQQNDLHQQELGLLQQKEAREAAGQAAGLSLKGQEAGYQYNPNTSSFTPTDLTTMKLQHQRDAYDPDSDLSNQRRQTAMQSLNEISPGLGNRMINGNMSANDIDTNELIGPVLKYKTEKDIKEQEFNRMMAMMGNRNERKDESDYQKNLEQNHAYTDARDQYLGVQSMVDMINRAKVNKADLASLPTELSNFVSHNKRLHSATIAAMTDPNSDILGKIQFNLSKAGKGVLDDATAGSLTRMLEGERQSALDQMQAAKDFETKNFQENRGRYPGTARPSTQSTQGLIPSQPSSLTPRQRNYLIQKLGGQ